MKKIVLTALILLGILRGLHAQKTTSIIPYPTPINPVEKAGWELIFQDEFEGDTLKGHWWPQTGPHGNGNEAQWYTPRKENVYVKDGVLHLQALRDSVKEGYPFSSSMLFSYMNFGKGSYIEVKCKLPKGRGLWGGFWLWGGAKDTYHELDICEFWCKRTDRFCFSDHYWNKKLQRITTHYKWIYPKKEDNISLDMSDDYYIYAVYWDDLSIRVMLNNVLILKEKRDIPQNPLPIILNLAVENEKKYSNTNYILPKELLVDYVRIYKRKNEK